MVGERLVTGLKSLYRGIGPQLLGVVPLERLHVQVRGRHEREQPVHPTDQAAVGIDQFGPWRLLHKRGVLQREEHTR